MGGVGKTSSLVAFGSEWVCIQGALLLCAILAFFRGFQMRLEGLQHRMVWTQLIREVAGGNWSRGFRIPGLGSTHQIDPDLWQPAGSRLRV